jgi:hypothetical protein
VNMSPRAAALALMLLTAPTMAAAKDKVDPRMTAMLACSSVTANEARLRCYDQAATPLRQAVTKGEVEVSRKPGPRELEGVIRAAGAMGDKSYWVELANGDRWEVLSASAFDEAPPTGAKVTLRKGPLGNYWFHIPGMTERRAMFIRPRS